MPVTKTAKRALRSSKKKGLSNALIRKNLELAIRLAKKQHTAVKIIAAIKLADKAAKKKVIHRNKAARIKSVLTKLLPKTKKAPAKKKAAKKK